MLRVIRFLPLLLVFAFVPFFNINVIAIRLSELSSLLEEAAGKQDILNNSSIVGKYELLKRRLEQGETRVENYALEARLQALTSPQRTLSSPKTQVVSGVARPLRAFLNGLRFALGKAPLHPEQDNATLGALEVAYLQERSRNYEQALIEYGRVVPLLRPGSDLQASALLHVAFCESIINNMGKARELLTRVITDNPGRQESVLAWKLLGFLDLIEEKRGVVLPGKPSELDRAKQTYLLVDYSNAIDLLTRYIQKNPGDPRLAEAYFFRARSREELGDLGGAADDYHTIASLPSAGSWAREGQRRLFLLGAVYGQGDSLAREALGKLAAYPEKGFVDAIRPYARIIDPSSSSGWASASLTFANKGRRAQTISAAFAMAIVPEMPMEAAAGEGEQGAESAAPQQSASAPTDPSGAGEIPRADISLPTFPALRQVQPLPLEARNPGGEPGLLRERIVGMEGERASLEKRYQSEVRLRRGYTTGSWISLGAGTASMGAMGYFLFQAFDAYGKYKSASSFAQAQAMREATILNETVAITTGVIGGIALTTALLLQLLAPHPADTHADIDVLDRAIKKLSEVSR